MIDGWMIKVSMAGSINTWLVKGYVQTTSHIIAIPYKRFCPIIEDLYRFLPCIGREVPLVPRNLVIQEINPFSMFKLRKRELPNKIVEFVEIIDPEEVGLTGSWALNRETSESDIDLLVYTSKPRKLYEEIIKLKTEGFISQCRSPEIMYNKVGSSWIVEDYIKNRVLESCYKGYPYTLRILRFADEKPCSEFLEPLGKISHMIVNIESSEEGYLVPARYKVRVLKGPSWLFRLERVYGLNIVLESWRTRYQELREGIYEVNNVYVVTKENEVILSVDPQGSIRRTASRSYDHNARGASGTGLRH